MTLETSTHRNILVRILKDIYGDNTISPILGFKGGTAVYLLYDLPRFSVDLDFDLLDLGKKKEVFETLKEILKSYGAIKQAREKRFNLFFLLSYHDKLQDAYNIKVEINLRNFGSKYEVKSYLGISMNVMVKEDIVAHKMVAMVERMGTTNRDIFDVWFFLKNNWPINEKIIEQRTNLSLQQFFQKSIDELELMSDRGILSGIGELLDAKQKAWVKSKMRTETIFLLRLKLESLS